MATLYAVVEFLPHHEKGSSQLEPPFELRIPLPPNKRQLSIEDVDEFVNTHEIPATQFISPVQNYILSKTSEDQTYTLTHGKTISERLYAMKHADLERKFEEYVDTQDNEKKELKQTLLAYEVCRKTAIGGQGADKALQDHLPWTRTWRQRGDLPSLKLRFFSNAIIAFFVYQHISGNTNYPAHHFPCHNFLTRNIENLSPLFTSLVNDFVQFPDLRNDLWPHISTAINPLAPNIRGLQEAAIISQATSLLIGPNRHTIAHPAPNPYEMAQYIPTELSAQAVSSIKQFLTGPFGDFSLQVLNEVRG
ncbi:hypothetical protein FB451DRAFT_1367835 [Mycena latifolia]|nr:hypothetical protein FB451DRAFT_1367835 [Mycena latifolia]